MRGLRERRFLGVVVVAGVLGGIPAAAGILWGFPVRSAVVAGTSTTGIALLLAAIASLFYCRWFPELDRFAEPQRRRALQRATPYGRISICAAALVSVSWLVIPALKWLQLKGGSIALVFGLATTWSAPVLIAVWASRNPIRRRLRQQLAEKGEPICVRCGYDTRGLPEPRCPECGESI